MAVRSSSSLSGQPPEEAAVILSSSLDHRRLPGPDDSLAGSPPFKPVKASDGGALNRVTAVFLFGCWIGILAGGAWKDLPVRRSRMPSWLRICKLDFGRVSTRTVFVSRRLFHLNRLSAKRRKSTFLIGCRRQFRAIHPTQVCLV